MAGERNLRLDLETNELNDGNIAQNLHLELKARRQDSFEDLLKQNQKDTKDFDFLSNNNEKKKNHQYYQQLLNNTDQNYLLYEQEDENLGENFDITPWLPPTIEKAKEFKRKAIYRNGDARVDSVELVTAPDLGIGASLYFQFALSMGIALIVMSLLSLPSIIFAYHGKGITTEDQDVLGLYKYTLGNIGYNPDSKEYNNHATCTGSGYAKNEICMTIYGHQFSLSDAASIITALEFVQIVVFYLGAAFVYHKSLSVLGRTAKTSIAISDYTVMVTNLPSDASDEELIQHFNQLYKLNEVDFMHRPIVEDVQPVQHTDYSNDTLHQSTWIADCILHKKIGGFISSFKSKQHVLRKLFRARACMKMYAENTPHALGPNLKNFQKAEKEVMRIKSSIERLTTDNIKKGKLTFIDDTNNDSNKKAKHLVHNIDSVYYPIQADAVAGFITFEYGESLARCVQDYSKYQRFPMTMFYPDYLKFRGNKIVVTKAPEPDQIMWENIEVPFGEKLKKRIQTNLITLILVIGCFIIILQASIYKGIFSNKIPSTKLCTTTIPALYANGTDTSDYTLVRPSSSSEQSRLDSQCQSMLGGSTFYGIYVLNDDFNSPVVNYTFAACNTSSSSTKSTHGLCPVYDVQTYCPCVSISSSKKCSNSYCYTAGSESESCSTFKAGSIGSCYCLDELNHVISTNGIASTMNRINDLGSSICKDFYKQYGLSVGLTYASVFATITVNFLLRRLLKILAKLEAHTSSDAEQGSIMTKIFLSNYVTMAIIVLVAYGKAKSLPYFLKVLHIFDGPYNDFTRAWYGNIGFYLMTTFILQSFTALLFNLVMYYFIHPILRLYFHRFVKENKSHMFVMQHDLNMLEVGPIFDPTDHTAQLLTLLFFTMTYAPGLPLLTPLCCVAFALYFRVDKVLLCRWYQKPPQVGDAAIRNVLRLLPYATLIRLAFACWMFGNQEIFPTSSTTSSSFASGSYYKFLSTIRDSSGAYSYINDRLFLPNLSQRAFFHLISTKEADVSSVPVGGGEIVRVRTWDLVRQGDPLRQQAAGLTKDYFRFIKHRDEIPDSCYKMFTYAYLTQMTELEVEEGWKIEDRQDFVVKVKIWTEEHRRSDGMKCRTGTLKRTYEVIADHRCSSYNIERVPAYFLAMKGLREGTAGVVREGGAGTGKPSDNSSPYFFRDSDEARLSNSMHGADVENGGGGLDGPARLATKQKKDYLTGGAIGGGGRGVVAVDIQDAAPPHPPVVSSVGESDGKVAKAATGHRQHRGSPSSGNHQNFTIDDFLGMEEGQATALTAALEAEQLAKEEKQRAETEAARRRAEKEARKKGGGGNHHH
eukprot:gene3057-3337_t